MVAIINGTRITAPKPDITIPSTDPNSKLLLINNPILVTEEKKGEAPPNVKIAVFKPEGLKEFSSAVKREIVRTKQREGDINEVNIRVRRKIENFKNSNLKGSRFAGELGKGSITDVTA